MHDSGYSDSELISEDLHFIIGTHTVGYPFQVLNNQTALDNAYKSDIRWGMNLSRTGHLIQGREQERGYMLGLRRLASPHNADSSPTGLT